MKTITISSPKYGKQTIIVDDEDYDLASKFTWRVYKHHYTFYARSAHKVSVNNWQHFSLHKLLLNTPKGKVIDHKNGNGLDNTRGNLRICTTTDNNRNKRLCKKNKTGFKGIYLIDKSKKWGSHIVVNKKNLWLGTFDDPISAALAYNEAAVKHYGEFAKLNAV